MKKVLATILAVIYLSTSMGATVHLHYCMNKLVAWGLLDHSGKDCSFCGMQNRRSAKGCTVAKKDCCRDEHRQIRTDKDQKPGQSFTEFAKIIPSAAILSYSAWTDPFVAAPVLTLPVVKGPPLNTDTPVFLRNCNFRI
jgi:hypothetical protein